MQITSIDEEGHFATWENQIRFSRQKSCVQSKSQAESVRRQANEQFRIRIFAANRSHDGGPLFDGHAIDTGRCTLGIAYYSG